MHILALIACCVVYVVGPDGTPVRNADVTFVASNGAEIVQRTDASGRAAAPAGFAASSVRAAAAGFVPNRVPLTANPQVLVLQRDPRVIGIVRVATGAPRDLHELPVPAAVLDAIALNAVPAAATDAMLRALPGVDYTRSNSAFTNYGQLRSSFDGAGENRGLVTVDGIFAQDGFGGQIDWPAYPSAEIARAELLQGAGSALYGSGAVGGALDLSTFGPREPGAPPDGFVDAMSGTRAWAALDAGIRTPLGPAATMALFVDDRRAAYRDFPLDFSSPIDAAAQSSSSAEQLRVAFGAAAHRLELGALASADQQPEGRPNYWQSRRLAQYAVRYSAAGSRWLLGLTAYARNGFVTNVDDQFPAMPGVLRYVQHVPTVESGFIANWIGSNAGGDVVARLDERTVRGADDQFDPGGTLQNSGSGRQWLGGLALQRDVRRGRFEALYGLRADRVASYGLRTLTGTTALNPPDRAADALSPRVALRYDLTPALALRASAGAGFRAPYLNELVRGFQIGKTVFAPNPNLVPERSASAGAGLDYLIGAGRLTLSVSSVRVHDAIAFETLSPTLQMRANVARTRTDGAMLAYALAVGPCARVRASGTTQYARVAAGPVPLLGKRLAFVPERSADVGIEGDVGSIGAAADVAFLGQTYADDLNTQPLGAVTLVGFKVGVPVGAGATLSLSGSNVTNRSYLSSQDRLGPPSTYALSLHVPIGPAALRGACSGGL